ncbi:MAG TPA: hypothetical protein DD612_01140 [Methylophilaceae bacterium]|nr:hypothetical protein [Methylophilaceae bacterium]
MSAIENLKSFLGNNVLLIEYIQDPSHGWIKVPKNLCDGLKFSEFSYQFQEMYFLEEDLDASLFLDTLDQNQIKYEFKEIIFNDLSSIRRYERIQKLE